MNTTTTPTTRKVYYGAVPCEGRTKDGKACTNGAYYTTTLINANGKRGKKSYRCGVHSKNHKRQKLPKDPDAELKRQQLYAERQALVETVAKRNFPKPGNVIVTKLLMMKRPKHHDGYLKVFPNFRHANRKDGFGCASLSPKSLGPIDHGMPGIPVALNLENYHQAAKVFAHEVDQEGNVTAETLELRKKLYQDPVPHRHKYPASVLKKLTKDKNINVPLFSLYYDKNGAEHRYSYLQCRYFYCHWYEKLAPQQQEFKQLQHYQTQGYNLQIVGYDGYPVTKDLYTHYLDTSRPFGHELVLYSLLAIDNPVEYPWNRYYRENATIYRDVI